MNTQWQLEEQNPLNLKQYLNSPEFLKASSSVTRLVTKLRTAVEDGQLYEAHQILRTIHFRFISHKDRLKTLCDLLYLGARHLLNLEEIISGHDVANLYVESAAKFFQQRLDSAMKDEEKDLLRSKLTYQNEIFHASHGTEDKDVSYNIARLMVELPENEREKFVAETMRLLTSNIFNKQLLHLILARAYYHTLTNHVSARYHFLHSANEDNAIEIANLLIDFHQRFGNKAEAELFIAQFTLQYLCLQNPISSTSSIQSTGNRTTRDSIRKTAETTLLRYRTRHPQLQGQLPTTTYPLLNFLNFITSLLDSDKDESRTFKALCDTYKPAWSRDPSYQSYLSRIGELYFGLVDQSRHQQQQGVFFNNILMTLLDSSDGDGQVEPQAKSASQVNSSALVNNDDLD